MIDTCADCRAYVICDAALKLQALMDSTRYMQRSDDGLLALRREFARGCRAELKQPRVNAGPRGQQREVLGT